MLIAAVKTNRNGYGKRESNHGSFGNDSRHEPNRNRSRMRRQRGQSRRRCEQSYQHSAVASAPAHHGALLHQRVEYPATRTRDRVRACVARANSVANTQARTLALTRKRTPAHAIAVGLQP